MAAITSLASASRPALLSTVAPRLVAFTQSIRPSWSLPCEPSTSASPVDLAPTASSWSSLIPSISSLMELFPSLVLTTPKKKKSRAARGKGMVNKWLKNRTNINVCPACGHPHLSHTICWNCYSQVKRRWKAEARGDRPRVLQEGYEDLALGSRSGDGRPSAQ